MMNSKNTLCMDKSGKDKEINKNGTPKNVSKDDVKSKKRRTCLRDKKAPKPPINGYIRFLNDRRGQFSSQNSNLPFPEITKLLAIEWNQMPADKKQTYLSAAEQERVKYAEELEAYKKTDAYRNFQEFKSNRMKYDISIKKERKFQKEKPSNKNESKKDQEIKKENPSTNNKIKKGQEVKKEYSSIDNKFKKGQEVKKEYSSIDNKFKKGQEVKKKYSSIDNKFKKGQEVKKEYSSIDNKFKKNQEFNRQKPSTTNSADQEFTKGKPSVSSDNSNTVHDIPIFTEEFLNFNKARDSELRNLRKKVTDQEQEVCVLDKHIENMQNFSTKLVANNEQLNAACSKYEQYLIKLRSLFLDAFANTSFPDNTVPPTDENIDAYIVNYSTHQATGADTDPSWITYFKKDSPNLDPSQC